MTPLLASGGMKLDAPPMNIIACEGTVFWRFSQPVAVLVDMYGGCLWYLPEFASPGARPFFA